MTQVGWAAASIGLDDVRAAHQLIAPHIRRTTVMTCASLDRELGAELHFKCENFQRTGAFKVRGAFNAVLSLPEDEAAHGVVTSSSGNHAAAVSVAAGTRGIPAYIAMPKQAVASKVEAVRRYGGEVVWVESEGDLPTTEEYDATVEEVSARTGAAMVHPYDDPRTIAGQATCTVEFLEDVPDMETLLAPVGGGGLFSGACVAASHLAPSVRLIGCEPEMADDARQSFLKGEIVPQTNPRTIADGLRTSLGDWTFDIIRAHAEDVVTVAEDSIVEAMRLVWQTMKIVIEPSAAVPVAALLEERISQPGRTGVIVSGGNVDLDSLPW